MPTHSSFKSLPDLLVSARVPDALIDAATDSGFYMRRWVDPFSGRTWQSVSDMMYGNKQFSSSFEVESFIRYIQGRHDFRPLPSIPHYEVKSVADIHEVLAEPRRAHYLVEGSFTFRGQPNEYKFKRKIPSPVRADKEGYEVSILPGVYRKQAKHYSFTAAHREQRSFDWLLDKLEPNNSEIFLHGSQAYDSIRTEQHYATQTGGLDLTFDLDTAIFFATHEFKRNLSGRAYYDRTARGAHTGLIYCFRFRDPPVKRTEYLIKDFDLFKTFPPLRILRQECGLPLIGPHERNVAVTDLDCVIRLHPDFVLANPFAKQPEFMFPPANEDKFYGKLLELKDQFPAELDTVVEYEWARGRPIQVAQDFD